MVKADGHTLVILQTIQQHASANGIAWWADVGPALEPFGLGWDNVAALRDKGLIERSNEIGRLKLTPVGVRLAP